MKRFSLLPSPPNFYRHTDTSTPPSSPGRGWLKGEGREGVGGLTKWKSQRS